MSKESSGWRRSSAIAPPWVRTSRRSLLEPDEVLADRDRRDVEPGRQVADPGATVLLDDAGDVLLALPGEHVAGRGAGWIGHASPLVRIGGPSRGFD